jgi:small subunit ribosomal protein S21
MAQRPYNEQSSRLRGSLVDVRDNNIGQAMRKLKRILQTEGVFKEMRERQHFEKPSVVKKKAKASARKRHQRDLEKNLCSDVT